MRPATVIEVSDPFDVVVVSLSLGSAGFRAPRARRGLWPGVPAIVLAVAPEPQPVATRPDDVVLEKPYSIEDVVAFALRIGGDPGAEDAGPSRSGGSDAAVRSGA